MKSFTDLALEITRLMVMAFPGSADRIIEIVVKDVFLEALADPELIVQIQAEWQTYSESAVRLPST